MSNPAVTVLGTTAARNLQKATHEQAMVSAPSGTRAARAVPHVRLTAMDWGRQGEVSYVPKIRTQFVAV